MNLEELQAASEQYEIESAAMSRQQALQDEVEKDAAIAQAAEEPSAWDNFKYGLEGGVRRTAAGASNLANKAGIDAGATDEEKQAVYDEWADREGTVMDGLGRFAGETIALAPLGAAGGLVRAVRYGAMLARGRHGMRLTKAVKDSARATKAAQKAEKRVQMLEPVAKKAEVASVATRGTDEAQAATKAFEKARTKLQKSRQKSINKTKEAQDLAAQAAKTQKIDDGLRSIEDPGKMVGQVSEFVVKRGEDALAGAATSEPGQENAGAISAMIMGTGLSGANQTRRAANAVSDKVGGALRTTGDVLRHIPNQNVRATGHSSLAADAGLRAMGREGPAPAQSATQYMMGSALRKGAAANNPIPNDATYDGLGLNQ